MGCGRLAQQGFPVATCCRVCHERGGDGVRRIRALDGVTVELCCAAFTWVFTQGESGIVGIISHDAVMESLLEEESLTA